MRRLVTARRTVVRIRRLAGRAFRGERALRAVADLCGAAHALALDVRGHADVDRAPAVSRLERELDILAVPSENPVLVGIIDLDGVNR